MPEFMLEYINDPEQIIRAMCMDMFWSGIAIGGCFFVVAYVLDEILGYFREKRKLMRKQREEKDNEK